MTNTEVPRVREEPQSKEAVGKSEADQPPIDDIAKAPDTSQLEAMLSNYESDCSTLVQSEALEEYKREADAARKLLDNVEATQVELDAKTEELNALREAAINETNQHNSVIAIQGEWHGLRREKHNVTIRTLLGDSPRSGHKAGHKSVSTEMSLQDNYSGTVIVDGNTITNYGLEYRWSEEDNTSNIIHEFTDISFMKECDLVESEYFYSSDEPRDFSNESNEMAYHYAGIILDTDQIAEKGYPIISSDWYYLHADDGTERLVWLRLYKREYDYKSAAGGVPYTTSYYKSV